MEFVIPVNAPSDPSQFAALVVEADPSLRDAMVAGTDMSAKQYIIALVTNVSWRIAQSELQLLRKLGFEAYLRQRKGQVDAVIQRARDAGTFLGSVKQKFERTVDYAEDTIGIDTRFGTSLPADEVFTDPSMNTGGYGLAEERVILVSPVPTDNPFRSNSALQDNLRKAKAIIPPRPGESDALYFDRLSQGFAAIAALMSSTSRS